MNNKKNYLDIYEAYSMLSYGTRLTIRLTIISIISFVLLYVFRLNMLMHSIKYIYANIGSITPITTILSSMVLVAYMFRNGQVMAYLKTIPSLISSMFDKSKFENEKMIQEVYYSIESIRVKQEEEMARFESIVLEFNKNIEIVHKRFTDVKEIVNNHAKKIEDIISSNEVLKEQQLTILQNLSKWKS